MLAELLTYGPKFTLIADSDCYILPREFSQVGAKPDFSKAILARDRANADELLELVGARQENLLQYRTEAYVPFVLPSHSDKISLDFMNINYGLTGDPLREMWYDFSRDKEADTISPLFKSGMNFAHPFLLRYDFMFHPNLANLHYVKNREIKIQSVVSKRLRSSSYSHTATCAFLFTLDRFKEVQELQIKYWVHPKKKVITEPVVEQSDPGASITIARGRNGFTAKAMLSKVFSSNYYQPKRFVEVKSNTGLFVPGTFDRKKINGRARCNIDGTLTSLLSMIISEQDDTWLHLCNLNYLRTI